MPPLPKQAGKSNQTTAVKTKLGLRTTGVGGEIVELQGGHIIRSTGQKDQHIKVCTAKGPKDRRVRLSANTAIQFYDVQDRLGNDRPSNAVDWLITKAKSAIDQHKNFERNHNQENVICSELRRFDEYPDEEIGDNQMGKFQNSNFLSDSVFFDGFGWPESSPVQTTSFLQTETINSQLLNYVSQRGTLQSSNKPPIHAWVDPFSGMDPHQTLAFHYPALMPGLNGFVFWKEFKVKKRNTMAFVKSRLLLPRILALIRLHCS